MKWENKNTNYHELNMNYSKIINDHSWPLMVARLCRLLPTGRKNSC